MALIAEYEMPTTFATEALSATPDLRLEHETINFTADGSLRWVLWGVGEGAVTFEDLLRHDPSVKEFDVLTEIDGRRLYDFSLQHQPGITVFEWMIEQGIQLLDIDLDAMTTTKRVRCPSRDVYRELVDRTEQAYGGCVTLRIFREEGPGEGEQVTDKQAEVLCLAFERGYFDVPREIDLVDLAAELNISDTAVSQRLRRGIHNLVSEFCRR